MKQELEDRLTERFKFLNRDKNDGSPYNMFGIECGSGWFDLLWRLCSGIEKVLKQDEKFCFSQIKEKFGCYDKKTEVLTKNGWKYFKDIMKDDEIATLSSNGYLEYQKLTDTINYKYNGKMYYLKTRGVNLMVTPNHNLYIGKGSYYNGQRKPVLKVIWPFELTTYEKYFKKNKCFKKSANWEGKTEKIFILKKMCIEWHNTKISLIKKIYEEKIIDMEFWLKFLGWYIAEGSENRNGSEISVVFNNTDGGREKERVEEIINGCKFKYKISQMNKSAGTFRIYNIQIGRWLKENCGKGALLKRVPDFIKELNPELIKIFLRELYLGDGWKTKTAETLCTISKKLSDDVQELLLKAGYTSKIYSSMPKIGGSMYNGKIIQGKHRAYYIMWLKKSNIHNTANKGMSPSSKEELIDYDDYVYCVTVPNKIIYVRRNGIPVWCGNSLRIYTYNANDLIRILIDKAENESSKICEDCGKKGKTIKLRGWLSTLCPACFKKWKTEQDKHYGKKSKRIKGNVYE